MTISCRHWSVPEKISDKSLPRLESTSVCVRLVSARRRRVGDGLDCSYLARGNMRYEIRYDTPRALQSRVFRLIDQHPFKVHLHGTRIVSARPLHAEPVHVVTRRCPSGPHRLVQQTRGTPPADETSAPLASIPRRRQPMAAGMPRATRR